MKKTIIALNVSNFGSTGKIMIGIADATSEQYKTIFCYPKSRSNLRDMPVNSILIGSIISRNLHLLCQYLTGLTGCFSYLATKRFLNKISKIKPTIIHIHNLHNGYINLKLLFKFIKKNNIRVIWTLHDCWSFTGRCPHFILSKCSKWQSGCHNCIYPKNDYPSSIIDSTKLVWNLKRKWFTGVKDLTIVTPSFWLAKHVEKSFLRDYPIITIHNGIDLEIFKPVESNFKNKYNIKDKYIILGVSFGWNNRKGLDVFMELPNLLPSEFQIVLVGTNQEIDSQLDKRIISIHKTNNQKELAEIYSSSDLFVNPTREDNFPTVNIEALACGTPVLTFKTGGAPEIVNESCGDVVDCDDIYELVKKIKTICCNNLFKKEDCVARAKMFDKRKAFELYSNLYNEKK